MNEKKQSNQSGTRGSECVLEMSAFTITRERAVEMFAAAGFPRSPRQVSRWCKDGELRAIKQPTRTGIERYVINEASLLSKIEQLRRTKDEQAHPQLYGAEDHQEGEDDIGSSSMVLHRERERELFALRTEVRIKDGLIDKLMKQNSGMAVEIGRLRGHVAQLEGQVRQLQAPPTDSVEVRQKEDKRPSSFWRQFFRW